jgi:hypothetical protein
MHIENTAILWLIRNLRIKSGIKKLKSSIFRPSRITNDVADGFDTAYLILKNSGTLKTNKLEVFAKLGEDFIARYALEKAGMKMPTKNQRTLKRFGSDYLCPL